MDKDLKYRKREEVSRDVYTKNSFEADLAAAKKLRPAIRGAAISAAKKKFKQEIVISCLIDISIVEDLDITPTMAMQIIRGWINRGIKREILNMAFGIPGRTAAQKTNDFVRVEELVKKYKAQVKHAIKKAELF